MNKKRFWCLEEYTGETSPIVDEKFAPTNGWLCDKLNELYEENKELQYKLKNCEDARQSYKQDWKACSSYCDEYKSEIISLKDEVEGLIEENKELKRELRTCKNDKLFSRRELERENKELKEQLKNCTQKAKEKIRKQKEENAIRWANIGR